LPIIPGITYKTSDIADVRIAGRNKESDPDRVNQAELDWIMSQYPIWRSYFDGTILQETIPATDEDGEDTLRYPLQFNLVKSYCGLQAGFVWGRGRTGSSTSDLFNIRVSPKVPGMKEHSKSAPELEEALRYFWHQQTHIMRPNALIQQWAGGCVLKLAWAPESDVSVLGVQLETIQPEFFYPIWDPMNYERLIAVKLKFFVSAPVAREKYGLTSAEIRKFGEEEPLSVVEYWDRNEYVVAIGEGDKTVVARDPNGIPYRGQNPFRNPVTNRGIIPFFYIPRQRSGGFFGDSLAYELMGIQDELNKTLGDQGDALGRATHVNFGISDYTGEQSSEDVIRIPISGAFNMGRTKPGSTPAKVHDFPAAKIPPETPAFTDRILQISEVASGLTPAARGGTDGNSALAMALQMLPTTNMVDSTRSFWQWAITGANGINKALMSIWHVKAKSGIVPPVSVPMFNLSQDLEWNPVIPRDRIEVIDEVVRLATANAVSPREWLKRLGDIENLDEEYDDLLEYLAWRAKMEAAQAGREITITENDKEEPAGSLPEVNYEQPPMQVPAKQPQGMKSGGASGSTKSVPRSS
jgi:hypothetical protein